MDIKEIHPKHLSRFVSDSVKSNEVGHIFEGESLSILQQLFNSSEMLCIRANEKGFKVLYNGKAPIKAKEPLKAHRKEYQREKLLNAMAKEVGIWERDIYFDIQALEYITSFEDNSLLNATEKRGITNRVQAQKWAVYYNNLNR